VEMVKTLYSILHRSLDLTMTLPKFNNYIKAEMMELEDIDVLITSKDFGFDEILFYTLYLLLILIVLYYLKKQVKHKI
ncbi:hypothetical protein ACEZA5_13285, partial [Staphylococcus aureus]